MKIDLLKIKSSFPPPQGNKQGFDSYVASIEHLVKDIVPESIFEVQEASHFIPTEASFQKLHDVLPIVKISSADEAPCSLSIALLCLGDHSHGVGRYFCDRVARFLIPGKHLPITVMRSLNFKFLIQPDRRYFITELYFEAETARDLHIIQENYPKVAEEIRLTTLGVEHARKVVLTKGLSMEEKGMILLENLTSLIKRPHKELHHTIFEETHHVLLKALQEKDPHKIPDHLLPLLEEKPQEFDSTIFNEIQNYLMIFDPSFAKRRPLLHLNKLLSYLYLFRKIITHTIFTRPQERHTSFKLLKTELKRENSVVPTLAFLIGINLMDDREILEEHHVFKAIQEELPHIVLVEESLITKKQGKERVRILYLEIQNDDKSPFTADAVKCLKKKIPKKIKECIQRTPAPLPSHYSDEETMRNILTLSKELKNPNDPPQVIIQFHNQWEKDLLFSVIITRIQKSDAPHLTLPNTAQIQVGKSERKVCGILNKRHLKEAYVFDIHVKGSAKIAEGRQKLIQYLKNTLHELNDFNGGMISKQYETLAAFKNLLADPVHDPLIENYFYSLSPSYMQSLIPPEVLKEHFSLLLNALDHDFLYDEGFIVSRTQEDYALLMVCSTDPSLIDRLKELSYTFVPNPSELLTTYLKVFDLHALGFLLSPKEQEETFKEHLEKVMREHKTKALLSIDALTPL
ncbi:MAG: hypothetical protein AB7N99_04185 [Simkaniaceae bacterium]